MKIFLYIPKIDEYLKKLTDEEVEDFEAIIFSENFKSTWYKLHSEGSNKQNLRKVAESLHIFLTKPDEVEQYAKIMQSNFSDKYVHHYNINILNLFDPELELINCKAVVKNKLK